MKKILSILATIALSISAHAQLVTATVTITNSPVNTSTLAIQGYTFTWTNGTPVGSFAVQITNTFGGDATNLATVATNTLAQYGITIVNSASNAVQFTRSVILSTNYTTNWASVVLTTNGSSSNPASVVVTPAANSSLTPAEQTNLDSQLVADIDQNSTNLFRTNSPALANFASFTFGLMTSHDNSTNFWLPFNGITCATILATGDVCFTIPTNGPGKLDVRVLANGANRNILWPTNFITLNTNGLILNGTNWQMVLTNSGHRIAYCAFTAFTNAPNGTNVIASCSTSGP